MKKRLGIYATYDREGNMDDYITYCLRQLKKSVDVLIVVSNQKLTPQAEEKISFADHVYERLDEGFDVGAFADVFTNLYGWQQVYRYDEILLMNDSTFGPFYPLDDIFKEMDKKKDIDFWGLVKRGKSDFDGGDAIYPEHIQLYFYVVRSRMLHSREFAEYWENIPTQITDFRSAITNYEFAFTKHFEELGFQWDTAVKLPGYDTDNPKLNLSPYHYNSLELIKSGRCPFLKRKLFTGDFVYGKYSDKSDLRRAFEYVKHKTDYDENLIWNYILKKYHLSDIMRSLCLYTDIGADNLNSQKEKQKYRIYDLVSDEKNLMETDEAFVLFLSLKREKDETEALYASRRFAVTENMMADEDYIQNVIRYFSDNPKVGVLIPPINIYGRFSADVQSRWRDEKTVKQLYGKLNLTVPFCEDKASVYGINALWCRKEIIEKNPYAGILEQMDETVLQIIPLIAQQQGYYTEVLQNRDYLKYTLANWQNTISDLWNMLEINCSGTMDIEECETEIIKRKIERFLAEHSYKVYIYGAGERAVRVISVCKNTWNINGIYVSDTKGNAAELLGYPVQSIERFCENADNAAFIVTVGERNRDSVINCLKKKGIKTILAV